MHQDWITRTISSGLQKLILLSLDHAPALDVLAAGTLPAWVEAVTYGRGFNQQRDEPRIQEGFRRLMATATVWPTPRQLLEAMPPLASSAPTQRRLPSDEKRESAMRHIAEISAKLGIRREA